MKSLKPHEIRFSQSSINEKKYATIEDWNHWDNNKYGYGVGGNFLLVVELEDGQKTSFDNSRLVIAQNEEAEQFEFRNNL